MSTLVSQWPHVNAPNQRDGMAWGYSHLWHASNLISAAQEKQRYEIAPSSTGEGIRQSGHVRYAISPKVVGRSGDPPQYPITGIRIGTYDGHMTELPSRS
jgi:hypothetical protein